MKQAKAARHIRELFAERGVEVVSRRLNLPDGQHWVVFERNGRQVGVDMASGIWLRKSTAGGWRCVAMPLSTSGAIMAAEFLCKD